MLVGNRIHQPFTARRLNNAGDPSITGDYSGALTRFSVGPPAGETWFVRKIRSCWQGGAGEADLDRYLVGGAALTTGMRLVVEDGSQNELVTLVCNAKVKTLSGWVMLGFTPSWSGEYLRLQLDTIETYDNYIRLSGDAGEKVVVHANDDMTSGGTLASHCFSISGFRDKDQW